MTGQCCEKSREPSQKAECFLEQMGHWKRNRGGNKMEEILEKQGTEAERLSREIEREARRFPRGLDLEEEA